MVLLINVVTTLILSSHCSSFSLSIKNIEENLEFLKEYLKFPIYVNPHPRCALDNEECTLDSNCCGGLECKMVVGRKGVKYACQNKVVEEDGATVPEIYDVEEEDGWDDQESDGDKNSLREIYRTRLEELNERDQKLLDDQYSIIKELQKPLSFNEMRELQYVKEIDDYKRENELRELRKWAYGKEEKERRRKEEETRINNLAIERVAKVLKEEEEQKRDIFKETKYT